MLRLLDVGSASVDQKQNIDVVLKAKGSNKEMFVRSEGAYIEVSNA